MTRHPNPNKMQKMVPIGLTLWAMMIGLTGASVASAMEDVNVATPGYGLIELPVVVAMRNGYFRDERLEVRQIQIEPDVSVKTLLAGEVNFSLAWQASVRAAASGLPIKIVAALVTKPPYALMARADIRSGEDLRGKTLGIDVFASTTDYLSRMAVRYLGVEAGKIEFVEIGNTALRLAALKTGEIQAAAFDLTGAIRAEQQGMKRLVPIGEVIEYPMLGVAATTAQLATKREQTTKFVRAMLRAARFIKKNRAETIPIMQRYLKVTSGEAAQTYDAAARYFTDDGLILDRLLALSVRRARDEGQAANDSVLSEIADWSILREIMAERRKVPPWLKQYDP